MAQSLNLVDRVALVTGAAKGIGFAIARELAVAGADVVIGDLDAALAAAAADRIANETDARAYGLALDVSNQKSIERGIAEVRAEVGTPAILVNNAGLYRSTPILEITHTTWQLLLDVMLTGPLLMSQAVLPAMIDAKWGRILNLGSLSSVIGYGEDVAYCAAKSGIAGMTRSLAAELAQHQICVNTICPGNVLTELMRNAGEAIEKRDGLDPGQFLRERAADIPLGRLGDPEDIAHLAVFLCADQGQYITGQSFHVNGGLHQT